jgi:hypothetical protein
MYCKGQKALAVLPNSSAVGTAWPLLVGWLLNGHAALDLSQKRVLWRTLIAFVTFGRP